MTLAIILSVLAFAAFVTALFAWLGSRPPGHWTNRTAAPGAGPAGGSDTGGVLVPPLTDPHCGATSDAGSAGGGD